MSWKQIKGKKIDDDSAQFFYREFSVFQVNRDSTIQPFSEGLLLLQITYKNDE